MKLLVVLIEHHYLLKRQVLYFVYGLRHAVKNCIWLALVIGTWKIIFRNNTDTQTIPVITKVHHHISIPVDVSAEILESNLN
jgi:hypothetical protein